MKSINRSSLLGHVVADPEIQMTKTGKTVAHFSIATNNEWRDVEGNKQRSVDFHKIVAWEGLAKLCSRHIKKGTPLFLEGRLSNRSYEGKDKIRRYVSEIIANRINILEWELGNDKKVNTKELVAA